MSAVNDKAKMKTMCVQQQGCEIARAAFALNNMGVSMLENGYYKDAIQTFKGALSLVKKMIKKSNSDDNGRTMTNVNTKLKSAGNRLRKQQKRLLRSRSMIEIRSLDEGDVEAMKAAAKYGSSFSLAFPIRIRAVPTNSNYGSQIGIMMYNQGTANLLAFIVAPPPRTQAGTFLSSALKYLHFADTTLTHASKNHEAGEEINLGLVSSLVFSNLYQVYMQQSDDAKADAIIKTLVELEEAIDIYESNLLPDSGSNFHISYTTPAA